MWASKPATMIRKVAMTHALREAFPSSLGGLYTEDEMQVQTDYEGSYTEYDADPAPRQPRSRKAKTLAEKPAAVVMEDDPFAQPAEVDGDSE